MIIGLVGLIGSGKTTVAKHLIAERGFIPVSFKDPLLDEVKKRFPDLLGEINSYYRFGDNEDILNAYPRPPLIRRLLQNYGTNVRRADDKDYWVDRWTEKVQNIGVDQNIVADDVRFLNEALRVQLYAGKLIRIVRPNGMPADTHVSEREQSLIETAAVIGNHGSIEQLHSAVNAIIGGFRK